MSAEWWCKDKNPARSKGGWGNPLKRKIGEKVGEQGTLGSNLLIVVEIATLEDRQELCGWEELSEGEGVQERFSSGYFAANKYECVTVPAPEGCVHLECDNPYCCLFPLAQGNAVMQLKLTLHWSYDLPVHSMMSVGDSFACLFL